MKAMGQTASSKRGQAMDKNTAWATMTTGSTDLTIQAGCDKSDNGPKVEKDTRGIATGSNPVAEIDLEETRQVQLQATRDYVLSDDYVASYARNEAGYVQPGDVRVVPLTIEETPIPTPQPTATPDPAAEASPWQVWWELLTDADQPSR